MKISNLFFALSLWPAFASAGVVVQMKTQHGLDAEAVEQAGEFLRLNEVRPERAHLILLDLKRRSGLGPDFLSGVLDLVLDRSRESGAYESKSELLGILPAIANSNRFTDLWKTELGTEIKQKLNRLAFTGRGEIATQLSTAFSLYDASDWKWIADKIAGGQSEPYVPALLNVPLSQVPFSYLNRLCRVLSAKPELLNLALLYYLAPQRVDKISLVRKFFAEYKNSGDLGRMNFPMHAGNAPRVSTLYSDVLGDIQERLLQKDSDTVKTCELARAMEMKKEDPQLVNRFFERLYSGTFARPVPVKDSAIVIAEPAKRVVRLEEWRTAKCSDVLKDPAD